jgi:AraC-like DNA-binding protein
MAVRDIIGVRVRHCQIRKNQRSFYYSGKSPGWDEGSTLYYVLEGRVLFSLGGMGLTGRKNDIVIWDPGMLREVRPMPKTRVTYCALRFDLYSSLGELIPVYRLGLPHVLRSKKPKTVWKLLAAIHNAYNKKRVYYLEECSRLGCRLFRLLRTMPLRPQSKKTDVSQVADARILATLSHMAENYKARHNIRELSQIAGMHPTHYNRLFRSLVGMTPYRYLLDRKIEKAKDFLRLYDESPGAVSLEFGFHDYAHFYRIFRRITGMTPSEYVGRYKKP